MSSKGPWYCDCQRYCGGVKVSVSRTTFYDHRSYRNQLPAISSTLLAEHQSESTAIAASSSLAGVDQAFRGPNEPGNTSSLHPNTDPVHYDFELSFDGSDSENGEAPEKRARIRDVEHHGTPLGRSPEREHPDARNIYGPRITVSPTNPAPHSNEDLDDEEMLPPPVPQIERPVGDNIDDNFIPRTEELKIALQFKKALEAASLENGDLDANQLYNLRNPPQTVLDIDDRDLLLSLKLFISTTNASDQVYNNVREDIMEDDPTRAILSHAAVKKVVAELTGVVPIVKDMCPNSCIAYTGPFTNLEACPYCDETRYDPTQLKKVSRQHFYSIPLGPQLQALWQTAEGAWSMGHRARCTAEILEQLSQNNGIVEVFNDVFHGRAYLEAVARGDIRTEDMVLLFSMDGAQLYQDKQSDCWIYIWVIFDLPPSLRYKKKHVLPGGFISGPHNPRNSDSFHYPGFHHLAALQKEGLRVWNAATGKVFTSYPFLHLGGADGPGSVHFTGLVGHHGAYPCRLYCDVKGRHKPGGPHYYPALLKPDNYNVPGCNHDDIKVNEVRGGSPEEYEQNLKYLLNCRNPTDFKQRRKDTGISTISIFSGLPPKHRLPLPAGFPGDSMHVPNLNLGELLPPLWRGMFQCASTDDVKDWDWAVLTGDIWKDHGAAVARARPYIPGCYDRPPRNIAEKISSGYKAKEWQGYFYGLAPALLHDLLPKRYWQNFCKLVHGIRIIHQRSISRHQLQKAHKYLQDFHEQFELLYCQRRTDHLHIMCPCMHALLHLAPETVRLGPVPLYSAWTMERVIGDLGGEIRQLSNPYQNLSERGVRHCQINALKASFPALDRHRKDVLPRGSLDLEDGYVLLRAKEKYPHYINGHEGHVMKEYIAEAEAKLGNYPSADWSGPISLNGEISFAEVQFYFVAVIGGTRHTLALVSQYGPWDETLFQESFFTVWSMAKLGVEGLQVIQAKSILSVVSVQPHDHYVEDGDTRYFVWEQMALLADTLPTVEDDE